MSISTKITNFIINTKLEDIPLDVINYSKFALADYFAVLYAGSKSKDYQMILNYAKKQNQNNESSVISSNDKFSAQYAALINGTTAHALDFDDVGLTAINHPTVSVAPVVFAVGEKVSASGSDMLQAFTIGVEILQKVASLLMPTLTNKGWHTTSVFGTIGATVAASILYKLNKEEIINALGIATSLASGLRVNFGTYTKPFHAGMSAQNGIVAAELALSGFTASEFAYEGQDGFAMAFTDLKISETDLTLGGYWDAITSGFQFKKYPVCSSSHTAIDALLLLISKHNIKYSNIKSIKVGVSEFAFRNLLFNNPTTAQEAKFSMPYAISTATITGYVTLDDFKIESITNPTIIEFMHKVSMVLDDEFKDKGILNNEPAIVYITLDDGTKYSERVDYAVGTNPNPLSKEQLKKKFLLCFKDKKNTNLDELFFSIFNIEKCENIKTILNQLS